MKPVILSLLMLPLCLFGQGSLSGRISDTKNNPFEFCKIILSQDSTQLFTTEADSIGNYAFASIADGNYQLHILLPFEKMDTAVSISGITTLNLQIDVGTELNMVEITATKPSVIRKVDRTIFDPSNIPALVGGNTSDVIEFAPGVYINGDDIHLANGQPASVMLNDKPIPMLGKDLISFIKAIPTEDIQYIEIVPIPPVKYVTGVGSFINIKLLPGTKSKYSKAGIELDVGQRFYSDQGANANYALRRGKFSLYSTLSLDNSNYHPIGTKTIDYDTLFWDEKTSSLSNYKSANGSLGLNYDISPTTEIGLLAFHRRYIYDYTTFNSVVKTNMNNNNRSYIDNHSQNLSNYQRTSVNLNLTKRLDTLGQKLDFNIDYTNNGSSEGFNYQTAMQSIAADSVAKGQNEIFNTANLLSGGIDYNLPLKKFTLALGARYSFTQHDNDLSVFDITDTTSNENLQKSNRFVYTEHIQAAYTSFEWKIKRFSFQAGLRVENTSYNANSKTSNETYSRTYLQLVPKVFVMYEAKSGQTWNLNYTRDFDRPYYNDLNPFKYYTSQFSYTVGNPNLQPSIRHSITATTNVKDIQFQLYSSYYNNASNSVTVYNDSTQMQYTTTANYYNDKFVGLVTSYYKSIKKRINIDANIYTSYSITSVKSIIQNQDLKNLYLSTSLSLRFTLDKKQSFFASLTGSYMSPFYQQISLNTEGFYTSVSIRKNLLKNRMTLSLYFSDPFRIMNSKSKTIVNNTLISTNYYHDMQSLRFSFSYKFGNNRLNINQHSTNSSGEAGRIK